jgi:hypothetical protein
MLPEPSAPRAPPEEEVDDDRFYANGDEGELDVVEGAALDPGELEPDEPAEAAELPAEDPNDPDRLGAGDADGAVTYYDAAVDGEAVPGLPTRAELVAASPGPSAKIAADLAGRRAIFFMPVAVEETNEYRGGPATYALRLYGALMDGSKAEVTVTGIAVFFDVAVPAGFGGEEAAALGDHLRDLARDAGATDAWVGDVWATPSRGYAPGKRHYKRVYTLSVQTRKAALEAALGAGHETASDDRSSYYRKAAREYGLPLSDWAVLNEYEYAAGPTAKSPLCAHVFRVAVKHYAPFVDPLADAAAPGAAKAAEARASAPLLVNDRTLVLAYDIETKNGTGSSGAPVPENARDHVFMICLTAHWKDDPTPLAAVTIVSTPCAPDRRWTTVVAGGETEDEREMNVLRAFALAYRALAPDIVIGFNDSNYDWPFILTKARRYSLLGWMVDRMTAAPRGRETTEEGAEKWNFQVKQKIKISAENTYLSTYLRVSGAVMVDVRCVFMKLYPKADSGSNLSSLKFYLGLSGLPSKADMPIPLMNAHLAAAERLLKTRAPSALPPVRLGRSAARATPAPPARGATPRA